VFFSKEVEHHLDSHVDCDGISRTKQQGSAGLRNNHDGVHKSVKYPGHGEGTEQVDRQEVRRFYQDVQESNREERQDVLYVIQVAPANKFDTAHAAY
jgi:hypothetical protein